MFSSNVCVLFLFSSLLENYLLSMTEDFFLYLYVYIFQAERYVDRKLDQAEDALKKKSKKAKKWYAAFIGDDSGVKINNLHIFLFGFTGGIAIGLASA